MFKNIKSTSSIVLGVISIVFNLLLFGLYQVLVELSDNLVFYFIIITILLNIMGFILAFLGFKEEKNLVATGVLLNILSVSIIVAMFIYFCILIQITGT